MSSENNARDMQCCGGLIGAGRLQQEFQHLRSDWLWLFLFGTLLTVCGAAAVVFPALTVLTEVIAVQILGIVLIVGGIATIVMAFLAGKWSGLLVQLLVGILYAVVGFMIADKPLQSAVVLTAFVAALLIVTGSFRILAAMIIRFPYWGWTLLNGVIALLLGVIIYRHFPECALWILGLLVGVEMLCHGWTWIMLSLAIRNIPAIAKSEAASG